MYQFLKETIENTTFELLIDTTVFPKDIVLKSAYNFLDKGYFFFRFDTEKNLILQFTSKAGVSIDPKTMIGEFSDELMAVYLRDKLEQDNKTIRETIVKKALLGPLDTTNFVTLDTDTTQKQNEIDFDKDIDAILAEIENDPDLKIDEAEIEKILAEIEAESKHIEKPSISINPSAISQAKDMFKNK